MKAFDSSNPDLGDDDPQAVKLMIDYLYLNDYDPSTTLPSGPSTPVKDVGDRPSLDHSGEVAQNWTFALPEPDPGPPLPDSSVLTVARDNASSNLMELHAKVFAIASKYDIKPLQRTARKKLKDQTKCDWNVADLIAAMRIIFNQTPETELKLRGVLKDVIVEHALTLVQHPGFDEAVAGINGLAYDLFCRKTYAKG